MKIVNKTNQITLAENIIQATSLRDQTLGLLAHKTPVAMLLKSRFGIHTLFMKYPIDVLILDKHNQVATMKEYMQPNTFFIWNPLYSTIIELPVGTISMTKTVLKDKILFIQL